MLVVVAVLVVAWFWLLEAGKAGALRADGQSAADAAALAAATHLQGEVIDLVRNPLPNGLAYGVYGRSRNAADDYARRNDGNLTRFDAARREFRVEVETQGQLQGGTADRLGVSGTRGEAHSRSRLGVDWLLGPPPARGGSPSLSDGRIDDILARNGYDPEADELPPGSALESGQPCSIGADVGNLDDEMHDVIVRLEMELPPAGVGAAVVLDDGYQTTSCGGWADEFNVHHPLNYGSAFRVASTTQAFAVAASGQPLCRPFTSDPRLFAHRDSDVCDGRTGTLGPGQAYGGSLDHMVDFTVELVPDEGPVGAP